MADQGGEQRRTASGKQEKKEEVSTGRMHQNVPEWSDPTCACEAEPYWQAVGEKEEEKMGKDEDAEPC